MSRNPRSTPVLTSVLTTSAMLGLLLTTAGQGVRADAGGITNADHRRVAVDASLEAELERLREDVRGPAWLTWTVPAVEGQRSRHSLCCWGDGRGGGWSRSDERICRLEERERNFGHTSDDDRRAPDTDLRLLLRVEGGRLDRLRAVTTDCALDVGGLPLYTLEGVAPRQSVGWLEALVLDGRGRGRNADRAIMAIAMHGDIAADRSLRTLTGREAPAEVREDAVFWLGAARGARGFERLEELLASETDRDVLEKTVFAVSISEASGATELLIDTARHHERASVREKALFWLGQQAGERAIETLRAAVEDDPDADVREQAVFAVSQLPRDEAVPLLVKLATTNRHPEVRKSALFWLGQTGDPRALALFEEILTD